MSKSRTTTRRPAGASTAKPRTRRAKSGAKSGAKAARVPCAMPACEAPRVGGKAHCSAHARQARERLRVAAGEAAWA
jgi:hypothetical protein